MDQVKIDSRNGYHFDQEQDSEEAGLLKRQEPNTDPVIDEEAGRRN